MGRPWAVAAYMAVALLAGCTGSNAAVPTPTPTATAASPTAKATLTDAQRRCQADGDQLQAASSIVLASVTSTGGPNGSASGLQATISLAEDRISALRADPVHKPYLGDQTLMIQGMNDLIEGDRALLIRGNRAGPDRTDRQMATRGVDEITAAQTDAAVKRSACSS